MVKDTLASMGTALVGALTIAACGAGGMAGASAPAGVFEPVPGTPAAFAGVSGSAKLTNGPDGGSDVAVTLAGLKSNTAYVSDLHVGDCDQPNPGGPHFKFQLDGPDAPPNEIQLSFTANATGHASATMHSTRRVSAGTARSIVVSAPASGPDSGTADATAAAAGTTDAGAGHQAQHAAEHRAGARSDTTASGAAGHTHGAKIACAALPPQGAPVGSP